MNRKGSGAPDRPHRRARVIHADGGNDEVTVEQLAALAGVAKSGGEEPRPTGDGWLARFVAEHLPDAKPRHKADGGSLWELAVCPFNDDHTSGEAFVGQLPNGKLYAGCHHNSCGWRWADLKAKLMPAADGASTKPQASSGRRLVVTRASAIKPRAARWLWAEGDDIGTMAQMMPGRYWLAHGALCLLTGRESTGKTSLVFWIAAMVTRGGLSGHYSGQPKSVIIAATEDSWAHTIVPRLLAAGADMDRVLRVEAVLDDVTSGLTLPTDVDQLHKLCDDEDVALLILDPVMSAVEGKLDPHGDRDVRLALEPLTRFAHESGVTIVGLIHFNKSIGTDLMSRIMGSRAFGAVARVVLMTSRELREPGAESGPDRYLFGQLKNNLQAKARQTKVFKIEGVRVAHDDESGKDIFMGRVEYIDTKPEYIEDVENQQANRKPPRETKTGRCEEWLEDYLKGKGPVAADAVKSAGRAAGFSRSMIYQVAREALDVAIAPIDPYSRKTTWCLDDDGGSDSGISGSSRTPGQSGISGSSSHTDIDRSAESDEDHVSALSVDARSTPRSDDPESRVSARARARGTYSNRRVTGERCDTSRRGLAS